jgi:ABC-2 type transport system ATP-binding protein
MLRVENLRKRFGKVQAVDGVSFEVAGGEIFGLLGPNGAGKTTTISMITGLLRPDEGRTLFEGVDITADPLRFKSRLGVVPQETALYEELTAKENLRFWGGLYGLGGSKLDSAVERTLAQVGLDARAGDPVKTYSGGMKRRLNLALGLVHGPRAVLLDEPTVGIDPQARMNILEVVRALARAGTAVLYTTHYLEEAETLCDRIAVMDHGKILAEGPLDALKRRAGEEDLVTIEGAFDADEARSRVADLPQVRVVSAAPGKLVLSAGGEGRGAVEVLSRVFAAEVELRSVSIQPPSLNSLFLHLTGRELRD